MGDSGKLRAAASEAGFFYAQRMLLACAFVVVAAMPPVVHASSANTTLPCLADRCGLHADGPYPDYVIGTLAGIGSEADVKQAFQWAKHHGYWKSLPDSVAPYLQDVKLITIGLPASMARYPVTVFVTQQEYAVSPYRVGDLVRYSPHGSDHEIAPKRDANDIALFHGLTGCVALLCRQNDRSCQKRYLRGVFTKLQGLQVNLSTGRVIKGGMKINPVSLLPAS